MTTPTKTQRFPAVDLLRGLVMVIMAIDHTRDFIHVSAMSFRPDDLTKTSVILFFTRWITHVCAPTFVFCAGLGAWFKLERSGGDTRALSRFLWTRGLWLLVLEFTAVPAVFFFNFHYNLIFLLVFWSLGWSMIALALLIRLPYRALFAVSVAMIALHDLTDNVPATAFGPLAGVWQVLHVQGLLSAGPPTVIVAYPLIPWIGVMALGFCVGRAYRLADADRQRLFIRTGVAMIAAFIAIRWLNMYGDPRPWAQQSRPAFTLLSFLNTTKYPPSLDFLLMTLGPALLFLGLVDRVKPRDWNPLLVFGRTPLFYFVVHLALIHAVEVGLTFVRYGAAPFLFTPPPTVGSARDVFPADFGWSLTTVYLATAGVVIAMYPLCSWLSRLKARRKDWWLSYL